MPSLLSAVMPAAVGGIFLVSAFESQAQVPTSPPEAAGVPWSLPDPERTRYFQLSNGMIGAAMPSGLPNSAGINWKQFMSGAAYAMRVEPTGGPDCNKKADDARITFWTIAASPSESRMAINADQRLGVVYVSGAMQKYVQAGDFCTSKKFVASGSPGAAFIYMPMAAMGHSLRNFTAMALTLPRGTATTVTGTGGVVGGAQMIPRITGIISGPGLSERIGGYVSADMLGISQALADGPGGAAAAEVMQQMAAGNNKVAEALNKIPGAVPGSSSEGSIDLNLSTTPMSRTANTQGTVFYVHLRAVHAGKEIPAGPAYAHLQALYRATGVLTTDPFAPNSTR